MENLKKVSVMTHEAFSYFQEGSYKEHLYQSKSGKFYGVYSGGPPLQGDEQKNNDGYVMMGNNFDVVMNLRPAYWAGIDYNDQPAESPYDLDPEDTKPVYFRDFPKHVQQVIMDYACGNRCESGIVEYTEAEAMQWLEYENRKVKP